MNEFREISREQAYSLYGRCKTILLCAGDEDPKSPTTIHTAVKWDPTTNVRFQHIEYSFRRILNNASVPDMDYYEVLK